MKKRLQAVLILVTLTFAVPAYAGPNKELIELQSQVQQLLKMQQSIDEKMGVLQDRINTLTQQVNDSLKSMTASADKLDKVLQQQVAASDTCVDQVTGQTQPIHDALTELRAQLAAMGKQLNDVNASRQSAPASGAAREQMSGGTETSSK